MGFLDRFLGAANKVADFVGDEDTMMTDDPSVRAAKELSASGETAEGVVTGIHFDKVEERRRHRFRVEWSGPTPEVCGLELFEVPQDVMRLGGSVPLRVDGDRAVLDADHFQPNGYMRFCKPPDPGVRDVAIDWTVRRRLKKARREEVTVLSMERLSVLGFETHDLAMEFRRADGSVTRARKAFVPEYCRRLVVPEATVVVGLDPGDPTSCDFDAVATAEAHPGGEWRDPVPVGSASALLTATDLTEAFRSADEEPVHSDGPFLVMTEDIEGVSLDRLALIDAALIAERVPPEQYDAFAASRYQVPAGRFRDIKAQWYARIRSEWQVAAEYGAAFERHRKDLKRKS